MTALSRTTLALLTATMLAGTPAASFAVDAEKPVTAQALPAIRVVTAARQELVETLAVNGSIVARDEAAAGTDLNGLIVTVLNADIGDRVKKGDVLAVLDRSMLDTQLAQMKATWAQNEASVAQMEAQIADSRIGVKQGNESLQRVVALQQKAVATQAQLDDAQNASDSARAKLESSMKALAATQAQLAVVDAQIRGVEVQIEKTDVRAPADGLVLARSATVGSIVSPSSGSLFRLAIGGEFELEATVAETRLPRLAPGMKAKIVLPGFDGKVEGSVRRIAPEIDQKSRLGLIRIALPKDAPAHAGSFARAEVELSRHEGIAVPTSSVLYDGDQALLQVVDNGRITTTKVKLGARANGFVEVVDGVSEGVEVVARAGTFVADGDMVTPVRGEQTGSIKP
jgi:HlyD family secretion protein